VLFRSINGGVLNGLTLGANWFLNPNTRVALNYDFTYRNFVNVAGGDGSGGINGFGTRLAFDFRELAAWVAWAKRKEGKLF